MIAAVSLFPAALLATGLGIHTVPMAFFVIVTGAASAGAM